MNDAPLQPVTLSERALLGLLFIQRYRFLSVVQFARASGHKPASASELLRDFERKRLLGSFGSFGIRGYGKTPKLYFLKWRGYELLLNESDLPEELVGPFRETHVTTKWSPLMYHRLATIDLLLALEIGVRERPGLRLLETFVEYRRVRRGGAIASETTDFVAEPEIGPNRIVPDAAFVLENRETHKRGLFFLETDMGTERIASLVSRDTSLSLHGRLRQYDRYLAGGRFARTYAAWGAFAFFTLLFVTTSAARVEHIRREMRDLPDELHGYYRLGVFETVNQDFFNDQWRSRSPSDHQRYIIAR